MERPPLGLQGAVVTQGSVRLACPPTRPPPSSRPPRTEIGRGPVASCRLLSRTLSVPHCGRRLSPSAMEGPPVGPPLCSASPSLCSEQGGCGEGVREEAQPGTFTRLLVSLHQWGPFYPHAAAGLTSSHTGQPVTVSFEGPVVPGLASGSPVLLASSCSDRCLFFVPLRTLWCGAGSGTTLHFPCSARRAVITFPCWRVGFRHHGVDAEGVHCTEAFSLRGSVRVHAGTH